jgi:hypothetical protein
MPVLAPATNKMDSNKIRKRASYGFWKLELKYLKTKPSVEDLLTHMHGIIDSQRGFHYAHLAESSRESLQQVIKDEMPQMR